MEVNLGETSLKGADLEALQELGSTATDGPQNYECLPFNDYYIFIYRDKYIYYGMVNWSILVCYGIWWHILVWYLRVSCLGPRGSCNEDPTVSGVFVRLSYLTPGEESEYGD